MADYDRTRGTYRRVYSGFIRGRRICAVSMAAEAWFWRLHALADDHGNLEADADLLAADAGGRRAISKEDCEAWLSELKGNNLIELYYVRATRHISIVEFASLQTTSNGKRVHRVPPPTKSLDSSGSIRKNLDLDTSTTLGSGSGIGIGLSALEEGNGEKPNGHARPHLASAIRGLSGRFSLEAIDAVANAYPPLRLGSPDRARRAIDGAMEAAADNGNPDPPGFILGQTLAFAQSWAGTRGQYTEKAATWFVDGGWKADPATWARPEEAADKPKRDIKAILRKAHANGQA